jgi:hypothetical protein
MSGSQSFCGSLFKITVATLCFVMFAERQDQILLSAGKIEFVTGKKKLKRESLVYELYHNKSQKHEKCSIWYQQKPIP